MTWYSIWVVVSFVGAVFIATYLVAAELPRRRYYYPCTVACCIVASAVSYVVYFIVTKLLTLSYLATTLLLAVNCLIVFVMATASLKITHRCNLWEALFCSTAGYSMQHISQRIQECINVWVPGLGTWANVAILVSITAIFFGLMYFFVLRKVNTNSIPTDIKVQIIVSVITLSGAIFINELAEMKLVEAGAAHLAVYVHIFSSLLCVLILFVEFYQIKYRNAATESRILGAIVNQERETYEQERAAVDIINIKCHDLKHQLKTLKGRLGKEEFDELRTAIYAYDSVFMTGNSALDALLYMKCMDCESRNISITCLADGKALSFMTESEVFSLFGNILDNAIEACDKVTDEEQRIITLNVYTQDGIVNIDSSNYFSGTIEFRNGLPVTTKEDKNFHGYGMSSVSRIVEKYDGSLEVKVNGNIFTLGISFFA